MSLAKAIARKAFGGLQSMANSGNRLSGIKLVAPQASTAEIDEIKRRIAFFFSPAHVDLLTVHPALTASLTLDASPILVFGDDAALKSPMARLHGGLFDVDWRSNPTDGWNWVYAANWAAEHQVNLAAARANFEVWASSMRSAEMDCCYVFGTGPSLAAAAQRDWSTGLRVVCNTIVRDAGLWNHIQPHAIVAGDGIYHFGFTEFAQTFRRDLRTRLEESPSVRFLYPVQFDLIVRRELGHLAGQLLPVPIGAAQHFHDTLNNDYQLPDFDNALTLLLLPLACALSHHVRLWGFDGRAPADKLFWSNSSRQSYPELMHHLRSAHPAFFEENVPDKDPMKYFRSAMGDKLEAGLQASEAAGWSFEILHESWTDSLRRRSAWKDAAL